LAWKCTPQYESDGSATGSAWEARRAGAILSTASVTEDGVAALAAASIMTKQGFDVAEAEISVFAECESDDSTWMF